MSDNQPQFLKELDKKLWTAAGKLRANLDAAVYKHAVLGLIFLNYVSDAFEIRQQEVESQLRDETDDYFLGPDEYDGDEMLEPFKGRVYDPAMGSGGFFVSSEKFIEEHGGKIGDVSVYGQESNPTTWRLAAMNMAIRGIDLYFGKQPASSFTNDLHPDLRADYVMANPPAFASRFIRDRNAETRRTQSSCPIISSALSTSPRFNFFEEVATCE